MKNNRIMCMILNFILLSTSTYSMGQQVYTFHDLIADGNREEQYGHSNKAGKIYALAYEYEDYKNDEKFIDLAKAIISEDKQRERTISAEFDEKKKSTSIIQTWIKKCLQQQKTVK